MADGYIHSALPNWTAITLIGLELKRSVPHPFDDDKDPPNPILWDHVRQADNQPLLRMAEQLKVRRKWN